MQPLDGVRVVDLTQIIAGPVATMHLGDYGADVVKVEHPDGGDIYREFEPSVDGVGAQWASLNRNKRSVTLDLSTDSGREALYDLAETADVFVENFKHGSTEKLEIDYETIREINPEIVYCSIRGFATGSINEDKPAYDMIMQAMSGPMSITGQADGPPTWSGIPMGDIAPGSYAAEAVLAALYGRDAGDGGGTHVEIAMFDALASWLGPRATQSLVEGEPLPRTGNEHPNAVPYKVFETADSYVAACVVGNSLWPGFCEAVDRPDLVDDERFATLADRKANSETLYDVLDEIIASEPTETWLERFREHGVPCGPVHDTLSVWSDPYAQAEDLVEELRAEGMDEDIPVPRHPARLDGEQLDARSAPKPLGADTESALREVGYDDADIERLRDEGAI
jgi:crotonobetainyl-CoA:carnitine CoA-transferase CaiB-like acyl-CoA transferase